MTREIKQQTRFLDPSASEEDEKVKTVSLAHSLLSQNR
jgi:hypothetical protein